MRKSLVFALLGIAAFLSVSTFVWFAAQPVKTVKPVPVPVPVVEVPTTPAEPVGALIDTRMMSRVGVVLDEIPADERGALVKELLAKPDAYWEDLAIKQVRFTTLRRNYGAYYGDKAMPLPPEELWKVMLTSDVKRETVDGHDAVVVDYSYDGVVLTDTVSPVASAEELGTIGGKWEDKLILPLDPNFVFQRTGFACMNESESPPNSIDAEEADFYYDQKCHVEKELSNIGCHQTELVDKSCEEAVVAYIGAARPVMTFERLPWDKKLADDVRVGKITNPDGPDLQPIAERFEEHRVMYRYIPKDSCTLVEKCVGDSGWRQLLTFPTGDLNSGTKALDIGRVDYFHKEGGSLLATHGVYELSACHGHYHFSHYGSFTLGDGSKAITHKQGFCLQPTSRLMNTEESPFNHPYANCIEQGVAVGWVDEYNMGLECQWIDVSDVRPQTLPLSFETNPDGMMCEGTRKFDAEGNQLFEPTNFTTRDGEYVDRPQCDFYPDWKKNNTVSYNVVIPPSGQSYVTEPCADGIFGPLRNCGMKQQKKLNECEPGSGEGIHCSIPAGSDPQIVRVCEASRALKTGIPCTYNEAVGSGIVESEIDINYTCPAARDSVETGGSYAIFTAPLFPGDKAAVVTCNATN
jgi:hypothetical protein